MHLQCRHWQLEVLVPCSDVVHKVSLAVHALGSRRLIIFVVIGLENVDHGPCFHDETFMGSNLAQHADNSSRLRHCEAATDVLSVQLHSRPGSGQRPRLEVDTLLNSKSCSGCDDYVDWLR